MVIVCKSGTNILKCKKGDGRFGGLPISHEETRERLGESRIRAIIELAYARELWIRIPAPAAAPCARASGAAGTLALAQDFLFEKAVYRPAFPYCPPWPSYELPK